MKETKFTPRPWKATSFTEHTGEQTVQIVPTDAYGIINRGPGPICEVFSQRLGIPDEACIANGDLMAAAPDLYEALEEIVENAVVYYKDSMDIYSEAIENGRKALAKARGEESEQG